MKTKVKEIVNRVELFEIVRLVNKELGLDIKKKSRYHDYVAARWVYYKLARHFTTKSLSVIGAEVGVDHATCIHGLKQVDMELKYNTPLNEVYHSIHYKLNDFKYDEETAKIENKKHQELTNSINRLVRKLKERDTEIERLNKVISNETISEIASGLSTLSEKELHEFKRNKFDIFMKVMQSRNYQKEIPVIMGARLRH